MTLRAALDELIGGSTRPVVVHSALWPVARSLGLPGREAAARVLDVILDVMGPNRTLLHPTFTPGYVDGVADLDAAPVYTGVLGLEMLARSGGERSVSACFSFAALGPDAPAVAEWRAEEPWGDDSLFAWIQQENAHLLMLGVPAWNCSFPHRIEWLLRDRITYREPKTLSGTVVWRGKGRPLSETLLVRRGGPSMLNTFEPLVEPLNAAGMRTIALGGAGVTEVGARTLIDTCLPLVAENPTLLLKPEPGQ